MRAVQQGRLDVGLTCRKRWLQPIPKAAITHSKLQALLLEMGHQTYLGVHYDGSN
jgi:hypothetical protein